MYEYMRFNVNLNLMSIISCIRCEGKIDIILVRIKCYPSSLDLVNNQKVIWMNLDALREN